MRGLRKYLTPFAPDQSGAVSMCYALGGIVIIVDAGGCAGNICGFDEPRWQPDYLSGTDPAQRGTAPGVAAVFSAGLRDMDAILGRDDLLVKKLEEASKKIDAKFIALVGTPVPAVIGTDLKSVAAMCEKKTQLPCIAVSTDGMHLYDRGIEEALLALVDRFARRDVGTPENICGVLGLNPLDLFDPAWTEAVRGALLGKGYSEVLLHGMEGGLGTLERCSLARKNYVVSPAGIAAAKLLEERFRIPYEIGFPADPMLLLEQDARPDAVSLGPDGKILVVHQQILAGAVRDALAGAGAKGTITAATWFDWKEACARDGDVRLREEDDFTGLVEKGGFDLVIADPALRRMVPRYQGRWIDAFHFAVSGQVAIDQSREKRRKEEGCL